MKIPLKAPRNIYELSNEISNKIPYTIIEKYNENDKVSIWNLQWDSLRYLMKRNG